MRYQEQRNLRIVASASLLVVALLGLALSQTSAAAGASDETSIERMSDGEIEAALAEYAPAIEQMRQSGTLLEAVPPEETGRVTRLAKLIATPEGRRVLAAELRAAETDPTIRALADADAPPEDPAPDPVAPSTPPAPGPQPATGSRVRVEDPSIGSPEGETPKDGKDGKGPSGGPTGPSDGTGGGHPVCPGFRGEPPAGTPAGGIYTPRGAFLGDEPTWPVHAGQAEVLVGANGRRFIAVRVGLSDPKKGFPVGALDVRVWRKPTIASHVGTAYSARSPVAGAPVGSGVFCVPSSTNGARGVAYVMVPLDDVISDPGFQLYAEVVEWDPWFQPFSNQWDIALAQEGPQYWAAGSQVTVHIGQAPMVARTLHEPAVGAFADRGLLVDDDGDLANDLEFPVIRPLLSQTIDEFLDAYESTDLVNAWAFDSLTPSNFVDWEWAGFEGTANFTVDSENPPTPVDWIGLVLGSGLASLIDLLASFRITGITQERPRSTDLAWLNLGQGDEDAALAISSGIDDTRIDGRLRIISPFWCKGSLKVDTDASFQAWIEEGNPTEEIRTHATGQFRNLEVHSLSMPWYNWTRPGCLIGWLLAGTIAKGTAQKALTNAVLGLFIDPNGDSDEPPLLEGLINDLDLVGQIDGLSLGPLGALNVEGFRDSCQPVRCADDESFLQNQGFDVMLDAGLGAEGSPFGDPWPAVYRPRVSMTVGEAVRSHTNDVQARRDVGLIVDAALVEVALRDLAASGALDLVVAGATVSPSVAPIYDPNGGTATHPLRFVVPDLRVTTGGLPLAVSLALLVRADIDPVTGAVVPDVIVQPELEALDCQSDYVNGYGFSYGFCGHANQSSLGLPTLVQILNQVAGEVSRIVVESAIAGLELPVAGELLGGLPVAFQVLELQQRGGHLALFARRDGPPSPAAVTLSALLPYFTFSVSPTQFPGTGPLSVTWQIRDTVDGSIEDTSHCTAEFICHVPHAGFALGSFGGTLAFRRAAATVTVSRNGVTRTATLESTHIP